MAPLALDKMKTILSVGYFPKELPPPFTTRPYADLMTSSVPASYVPKKRGNFLSRPAIHNLARSGTLRRKLSIPNPVNTYQLTRCIVDNWASIYPKASSSTISLTKPIYSPTAPRALSFEHQFGRIPFARAAIRAGKKYVLNTDINNFYPSIYTHSVPWALHGKVAAKAAMKSAALLGNQLDILLRNGQQAQTIGIPISPDTSFLIEELVLCQVDEILKASFAAPGFRYIDDMEFGFESYSDAENALAIIQEALSKFELQLNPRKSHISELPMPLEAFWVPHLRLFPFRRTARTQKYDLLGYFGRAFELAASNKEESIIRYALSRTSGEVIDSSNWALYQDLLLQCLIVEPGTTPNVVNELFKYSAARTLDVAKIQHALGQTIQTHAALGHGSEVAWAIWGAILLKIGIDLSSGKAAARMKDNIVAILLLDAHRRGLVDGGVTFAEWEKLMNGSELSGENWLLAYEANVKGWLPAAGGGDYVTTNTHFGPLKAAGVHFYDTSFTPVSIPLFAPPAPSGFGESAAEQAFMFDVSP